MIYICFVCSHGSQESCLNTNILFVFPVKTRYPVRYWEMMNDRIYLTPAAE